MNDITKADIKIAPEANKIFALTEDRKASFNRIWIWPASGITDGKRVANAGDIYIGERTEGGDFTPDVITTSDLAFLIQLPEGQKKLLRDVIFQADNSGDGVFFKYW